MRTGAVQVGLLPERGRQSGDGPDSAHRLTLPGIATNEPGGEPMRTPRIVPSVQLPLPFLEAPVPDRQVWPALPDQARTRALLALAELIARRAGEGVTPTRQDLAMARWEGEDRRGDEAQEQGDRP